MSHERFKTQRFREKPIGFIKPNGFFENPRYCFGFFKNPNEYDIEYDIEYHIPPLPPQGEREGVFQFGFCVLAATRRAAESANRKDAPGGDFRGLLCQDEKLPFRGIKSALWGRTGPGIGIQGRTRNRTREKKAFFLLPVDLRVVRPAEQIVYRAAEVIGYSSNRF